MTLTLRIALVGGVGALALGATIILSLPSRADVEGGTDGAAPVRVTTVEAAPTSRPVLLHGVTRATDRTTAAFTEGGRLLERRVQVGQRVRKGDVLARLDSAPLSNRVASARGQVDDLRARHTQVQADRARLQALDAGNAVAPAELERILSQETSLTAALAQAQAGLDEALRARDEGVLRARFDAEVLAVHAEPGETVGGGQPIVSLAGHGLELVVEAPESVWAGLGIGAPVSVDLPRVGCRGLSTTVERLGSGAGGPASLFPVHIALPDPAECTLAPGMTAVASLSVPVPPSLSVPVRAVVDPTGSQASVLRLEGQRVEKVPVTPVRLEGGTVSVTGELSPGDEVVVAGLVGLVDGQDVRVLR